MFKIGTHSTTFKLYNTANLIIQPTFVLARGTLDDFLLP